MKNSLKMSFWWSVFCWRRISLLWDAGILHPTKNVGFRM